MNATATAAAAIRLDQVRKAYPDGTVAVAGLTLDVPAGVAALRIAMNGHDEGSRNFDLFVKEGDSISATDNDCAQDGTGQYAFCEFRDPAEGRYSILLEAKSGNGKAQVSATLYGE